MFEDIEWIAGEDIPEDWYGRPVWRFHSRWKMPECAPLVPSQISASSEMLYALADAPPNPTR